MLICLNYSAKNRWKAGGGENWKTTICGDGYGYYAYLPCVFILHKFDYKKIIAEEKALHPGIEEGLYALPLTTNGNECNKYFAGTAILMSPFFGGAYILSYFSGYELNGYSLLFQCAISISALFYLLVGLYYLRKLLLEYEVSEAIICIALSAIVFGTNLFYYATMEPSMSHTYSFGLSAMFFYFTKRAIRSFNLKNVIITTCTLSLLVTIRPTNVLSLSLLPFFAGSYSVLKSLLTNLLHSKKIIVFAILSGVIIISIQLVLWYAQTGHFFVWSYSGEGFDFSKPHILQILFSYRNGWFIYTPLMLILLPGLFVLFKENRFMFFSFLAFLFLIVYVLSSWWCYNYGGFGLRAFIDFYPAFGLLLALSLNQIKLIWLKTLFVSATCLCVGLNLIQTYQFKNFMFSFGNMNKEFYWKIFLKTGDEYRGISVEPTVAFYSGLSFSNSFENNIWGNDNNITQQVAHAGRKSAFVDSISQFSPTFTIKAGNLPQDTGNYILVTLWTYMHSFNNNAAVVVSCSEKDKDLYFWESSGIKSSIDETDTWHEFHSYWKLPKLKNPDDLIKIYVWSTKGLTYIDDMEIKFGSLNKIAKLPSN
jgi:hypothetical protein